MQWSGVRSPPRAETFWVPESHPGPCLPLFGSFIRPLRVCLPTCLPPRRPLRRVLWAGLAPGSWTWLSRPPPGLPVWILGPAGRNGPNFCTKMHHGYTELFHFGVSFEGGRPGGPLHQVWTALPHPHPPLSLKVVPCIVVYFEQQFRRGCVFVLSSYLFNITLAADYSILLQIIRSIRQSDHPHPIRHSDSSPIKHCFHRLRVPYDIAELSLAVLSP